MNTNNESLITTYLSKKQVAQQLDCCVPSVTGMMKRGLPFIKFGKFVRITQDDLDQFLMQFRQIKSVKRKRYLVIRKKKKNMRSAKSVRKNKKNARK